MGKAERAYAHRKAHKIRAPVTDLKEIGETAAMTAGAAWLCYRSVLALLLVIPIGFLNHRRIGSARKRERRQQFRTEYREMLNNLAAAVSGGYSVEGAFLEAEKELPLIFGRDSLLAGDLHRLNQRVRMNTPVEEAFLEFAAKWDYEEVRTFAEIFSFAKRTGGDYTANIRRTAENIGEQMAVLEEMQVQSSEKRTELLVMSIMPPAILLYVNISSPDFTSVLYRNPAGVLFMTVMAAAYVCFIRLGRLIIERQEKKV